MEMVMEAKQIDKSTWGPGPWQSEPDEVVFEHKSLTCLVLRMSSGGQLNGYVQLPDSHPWHGKAYGESVVYRDGALEREDHDINPIALFCGAHKIDTEAKTAPIDLLVDVHGGLTFSGSLMNRDGFWFGFDCAHCNDLSPAYGESVFGGEYRDIEYVKAQVIKLADQLAVSAA